MPGRRYDDTPLPDDPGMIDRSRPTMNQLGRWLRRELLAPLGVSHRVNFENDVITIESIRDFLSVSREYARLGKLPLVPMELGDEELSFVVATQGQTIRVRVAGDSVPTLLTIAGAAFSRNPAGAIFYNPAVPIDLQTILRTLAAAEAAGPEPRPA